MNVLWTVLKWIGIVLVILICIVTIVPLVLILIDAVLRRLLWKPGTRCDTVYTSDEETADTLIVYLPGILADGVKSSDSLRNVWLMYGDVMLVSYTHYRFDASIAAEQIARCMLTLHERLRNPHRRVVFILSSMGGMLGTEILERLDEMEYPVKDRRAIFVDAPSGARDMLGGGDVFAPLMRILPFGPIYNRLLAPVMKAMLVPPKDENIEAHLDKQEVKELALQNMSEFPMSVWRDQLAYMAAFPFKKVKLTIPATYLRCDTHNETVKQPQAAKAWASVCSDMKIVGVNSPHCAYAERPRTWQSVFSSELSALAARR